MQSQCCAGATWFRLSLKTPQNLGPVGLGLQPPINLSATGPPVLLDALYLRAIIMFNTMELFFKTSNDVLKLFDCVNLNLRIWLQS